METSFLCMVVVRHILNQWAKRLGKKSGKERGPMRETQRRSPERTHNFFSKRKAIKLLSLSLSLVRSRQRPKTSKSLTLSSSLLLLLLMGWCGDVTMIGTSSILLDACFLVEERINADKTSITTRYEASPLWQSCTLSGNSLRHFLHGSNTFVLASVRTPEQQSCFLD